jgi:electron-transferring-flavoprotein dehydrogenase
LPLERILLSEPPDPEAIEMDVVVVGAGPAGLATAIELARLVRGDAEAGGSLGAVNIAVLDKASAPGEHSLSGAVINPRALRELFPDLKDSDFPLHTPVWKERTFFLTRGSAIPIPTPPTMRNAGFFVASLSELCRWMAERAEELGINLLSGFPVESLLLESGRVIGVRTTPSGLDRSGEAGPRFEPGTDLAARVVVLAEGSRGPLTMAWRQSQGIGSPNPQIFALGVKELWEVKKPLDTVIHMAGWPLPRGTFGGGFVFPLAPDRIALGLVAGLDSRNSSFDVHESLQRMKTHPFLRPHLEGGEMVEWGAKTIPEGGFYSLPDRRSGDGVLVVGDAAGFVDVASLKGIHYAMQTGIFAARAIFRALKAGKSGYPDCERAGGSTREPEVGIAASAGGVLSASTLAEYDRETNESYVISELYERRNMRLAFRDGLVIGGVKAGLMMLTRGRIPGGKIPVVADALVERKVEPAVPFVPDGKLTFAKADAVFRSGNRTRDDIPSHLVIGDDAGEETGQELAEFYQHLCPAGVYEWRDGRLVVNAPNCVDCRATDVLGPRWSPREGGSGPAYKEM